MRIHSRAAHLQLSYSPLQRLKILLNLVFFALIRTQKHGPPATPTLASLGVNAAHGFSVESARPRDAGGLGIAQLDGPQQLVEHACVCPKR